MSNFETVQAPLSAEIEAMQATAVFVAWINQVADIPAGYSFTVDTGGRKYIRIVMVVPGGGRSVHAFVDKTNGDLLMPAGWKGPAKGARGNILTGMEDIQDRFTWSGGYLYK